MLTFSDDEFKRDQDEIGIKPTWAAEAFADLEEDVSQSLEPDRRARSSPTRHRSRFVYQVETGELREVT